MSRRKSLAKRWPCGRIVLKTQPLSSPAETRRLRDLAQAGVRPAEWGTQLGRLYLDEKISELQFEIGKRWMQLAADYSQAVCAPRSPRTAQLDAAGGTPADPDSAKGVREVRRQAQTVEGYISASHALRLAGGLPDRVVRAVCEGDLAPGGMAELDALKTGLKALAEWWNARARQKG